MPDAAAQGHYEPSLSIVVLRGCSSCRSPHPQALGSDSTTCLTCGAASEPPGEEQMLEATFTGEVE